MLGFSILCVYFLFHSMKVFNNQKIKRCSYLCDSLWDKRKFSRSMRSFSALMGNTHNRYGTSISVTLRPNVPLTNPKALCLSISEGQRAPPAWIRLGLDSEPPATSSGTPYKQLKSSPRNFTYESRRRAAGGSASSELGSGTCSNPSVVPVRQERPLSRRRGLWDTKDAHPRS